MSTVNGLISNLKALHAACEAENEIRREIKNNLQSAVELEEEIKTRKPVSEAEYSKPRIKEPGGCGWWIGTVLCSVFAIFSASNIFSQPEYQGIYTVVTLIFAIPALIFLWLALGGKSFIGFFWMMTHQDELRAEHREILKKHNAYIAEKKAELEKLHTSTKEAVKKLDKAKAEREALNRGMFEEKELCYTFLFGAHMEVDGVRIEDCHCTDIAEYCCGFLERGEATTLEEAKKCYATAERQCDNCYFRSNCDVRYTRLNCPSFRPQS